MNPCRSHARNACASRVATWAAAFGLAGMISPCDAWARQRAAEAERPPMRVSVDLSTAYDHLDAGYEPWRDVSAGVAATFAPERPRTSVPRS